MDGLNYWKQFKISRWMPFDTFIHQGLGEKIIPRKIRYWICDKFDDSVLGKSE